MFVYHPNSVIVIITGYKNFASPIETARKNNIPVILIYGKKAPKVLSIQLTNHTLMKI
jgi:hypothetical protein